MNSYRPMRRSERQMTEADARALLAQGEYGVLSTAMERGAYGVPVNYAYNQRENCIYIHCAKEGQKLDNIARDNAVCFTVVGSTRLVAEQLTCEFESVIAFGRAVILSGQEYTDAAMAFGMRYVSQSAQELADIIEKAKENMNMIKIEIQHMTGKALKVE